MKQLLLIAIVVSTILLVTFFDAVIVFLLSGFIPGINVTLAPSTTIAVMIASTLLVISISLHRRRVYKHCLAFYDAFLGFGKKSTPQEDAKPKLPKRRYQEL